MSTGSNQGKRKHTALVNDMEGNGTENETCTNCASRNIDCTRPPSGAGKRKACDRCRQSKLRCEYSGPTSQPSQNSKKRHSRSPSASPERNEAARSTRLASRKKASQHDVNGDNSCYAISSSSVPNVPISRTRVFSPPPPQKSLMHQTKVPQSVSASGSTVNSSARGAPRPQVPPPNSQARDGPGALNFGDVLERTKESLESLKCQYEDTNKARAEALPHLKKGYFRLQNAMAAVTANLHEMEEQLLLLEPGDIEAFHGNFVALNAELGSINTLRREHDQILKQYEHLEELSRDHNLEGRILEHMAIQTKTR